MSTSKADLIKVFSALLALLTVALFVLLVLGKIDPLLFWIMIIVIAVFAYKIIPKKSKLI